MYREVISTKINFMKKSIWCLLTIIFVCMQITGCGSDQDQQGKEIQGNAGQNQAGSGDSWIAEPLILPHDTLYYEKVYQNTLYYVHEDTAGGGTAVYKVDLAQAGAEPVKIPIPLEEGLDISSMAIDREGNVHILAFRYTEEEVFVDAFWIKVDPSGALTDTIPITELIKDQEYPWSRGLEIDDEGNACFGVNSTAFVVAPDGGLRYQTVCESYIFRMCMDKAGKIYVVCSPPDKGMVAFSVDGKEQTLGKGIDLGTNSIFIGAGAGVEQDILLATDGSIYDYQIEGEILTEKLKWLAADLAVDDADEVFPLADGRILWVNRSSQDPAETVTVKLVRKRAEGEEVPAPQEQTAPATPIEQTMESSSEPLDLAEGNVTLGVMRLGDSAVKEAIVNFNLANPDTRIEIIEYTLENYSNYEESKSRLNADIASGNCPDILILPEDAPIGMYAAKGVIEDLNPYLNADSSLNRGDFQENILGAFDMGGKLYGIPVKYLVDCLVGKTSDLGNRTEWNLDEMIAFADSIGSDSMVFDTPLKSEVLKLCLMANGDSIISWQDEENAFNRELFIKMLQFSDRFLMDDQADQIYANWIERMEGGDVILMKGSADPSSTQFNAAILGEPVSHIGYPAENGNGLMVYSLMTVAISEKCEAKGTAWKFISSLLSAEVQEHPLLDGYPLLKSGMEKRMEKMKSDQGTIGMGSASGGSFSVEIRGTTDAELQSFREMIARVETVRVWDEQAGAIIAEEAGAFFSGSKSAEEVTDIIENRIRLYINESK